MANLDFKQKKWERMRAEIVFDVIMTKNYLKLTKNLKVQGEKP